jgi:hypothetical protein
MRCLLVLGVDGVGVDGVGDEVHHKSEVQEEAQGEHGVYCSTESAACVGLLRAGGVALLVGGLAVL